MNNSTVDQNTLLAGLSEHELEMLDIANEWWCLNIGKCVVRPTIYMDESHMMHCMEVGQEIYDEEMSRQEYPEEMLTSWDDVADLDRDDVIPF